MTKWTGLGIGEPWRTFWYSDSDRTVEVSAERTKEASALRSDLISMPLQGPTGGAPITGSQGLEGKLEFCLVEHLLRQSPKETEDW